MRRIIKTSAVASDEILRGVEGDHGRYWLKTNSNADACEASSNTCKNVLMRDESALSASTAAMKAAGKMCMIPI